MKRLIKFYDIKEPFYCETEEEQIELEWKTGQEIEKIMYLEKA